MEASVGERPDKKLRTVRRQVLWIGVAKGPLYGPIYTACPSTVMATYYAARGVRFHPYIRRGR